MNQSPLGSFDNLYIATGTANGKTYCKVGIAQRPTRRLRRFGKHYGVPCEFKLVIVHGMPSRRIAYAIEQATIYRCAKLGFEQVGGELFAMQAHEMSSVVDMLMKAVLQ